MVAPEQVPGGLRLSFTPASESALRQLIEIEKECCQWITFVLDGPSVVLTAAGEGEKAIREMWVVDATAG